MAEKDADLQKIRELLKIMKANDLVEIDIRHGDDQITLKRAQAGLSGSVANPIITSLPGAIPGTGVISEQAGGGSMAILAGAQEELQEIKSPMVGTLYEAPSPDSDPYVEIDSHVNTQTVVCIIEAMKVMNEIKAEVSGTIVEKCVKNGQAIEYGQVLFRVRPD
jgi:acetyl-CoA carboxylase biotin carboxyl carrier protein